MKPTRPRQNSYPLPRNRRARSLSTIFRRSRRAMPPAAPQRKRVSQACDRCRSRKDKCNGLKPICSNCASGGHTCSYDPSMKKRGLPWGYVRGLEKLWGLVIREAPELETTILSMLDRKNGVEHLSRALSDKGCEETLLDTWRKSRLAKHLDTLLPLPEIADDKVSKRKRQESPVSWPAYGSQRSGLSNNYPLQRTELRPSKHVAVAPQNFKYKAFPASPITGLLELPRNAWDLIDLYFAYTHCWLPILDKHNLLKAAHSYPTSLPSGKGSGDHASLWAVLAYAEHQQHGLSATRVSANQHQRQPGSVRSTFFYAAARKFIPSEEGDFELGHAQALLLLALLDMGQDRYKQAWLLSGMATRVAVELGLGSREDVRSRDRHVYLGCFVLDTIIAARLKREPHLRTQTVLKHGLLQENAADEWDPWRNPTAGDAKISSANSRTPGKVLSSFNLLVELVGLLNTSMLDHSVETMGFENYRFVLANLATATNFDDRSTVPTPQQYHNELLFSSLASLFGLDKQRGFAPMRTVAELLVKYGETQDIGTIPPTLDCFMSFYLRRFDYDESWAYDASLPKLGGLLLDISRTWPTFDRSVSELQAYQARGLGPRVKQPHERLLTQRPAISAPADEHNKSGSPAATTCLAPPPYSSMYTSSGQALLEAAIQFDPSLLTDVPTTPASTSPWAVPASPPTSSGGNVLAQRVGTEPNTQPQAFFRPGFSSPADEDAISGEFAAIDTLKWTGGETGSGGR